MYSLPYCYSQRSRDPCECCFFLCDGCSCGRKWKQSKGLAIKNEIMHVKIFYSRVYEELAALFLWETRWEMCIRIVPWYVACVFGFFFFLLDKLSVGRSCNSHFPTASFCTSIIYIFKLLASCSWTKVVFFFSDNRSFRFCSATGFCCMRWLYIFWG